jgi:hypothetical protein
MRILLMGFSEWRFVSLLQHSLLCFSNYDLVPQVRNAYMLVNYGNTTLSLVHNTTFKLLI